jgi:hypothetical protein
VGMRNPWLGWATGQGREAAAGGRLVAEVRLPPPTYAGGLTITRMPGVGALRRRRPSGVGDGSDHEATDVGEVVRVDRVEGRSWATAMAAMKRRRPEAGGPACPPRSAATGRSACGAAPKERGRSPPRPVGGGLAGGPPMSSTATGADGQLSQRDGGDGTGGRSPRSASSGRRITVLVSRCRGAGHSDGSSTRSRSAERGAVRGQVSPPFTESRAEPRSGDGRAATGAPSRSRRGFAGEDPSTAALLIAEIADGDVLHGRQRIAGETAKDWWGRRGASSRSAPRRCRRPKGPAGLEDERSGVAGGGRVGSWRGVQQTSVVHRPPRRRAGGVRP